MNTNNLTQRVARLRDEIQRENSLNQGATSRDPHSDNPLVFGWDQSWDQHWDQTWPQAWNQNGARQGLHQHKKVGSIET